VGDGLSVGSGVAAAVVAGVGGTVVEIVPLVAVVDRTGVAIAACVTNAGCWETAVATPGTVRDCEQAASIKASKIRAGIVAAFLTRFSLGDDYSSVGYWTD
jgi:hypothetical protein